jgi:TRAP-type C4-dicarboxylate transport system permease small subunit
VVWINHISEFCGKLAAWLFFAIAAMITYEVIARYVFLAPTIWAEEMSQFFQIWATYLAAAYVLKHRKLISIDTLVSHFSTKVQWFFDLFAYSVIAIFCLVAIFYGSQILIESIQVGRSTSTMMAVPKWMTESAIPIGFTLLLLQTIAEIINHFAHPESSKTLSGDIEI